MIILRYIRDNPVNQDLIEEISVTAHKGDGMPMSEFVEVLRRFALVCGYSFATVNEYLGEEP